MKMPRIRPLAAIALAATALSTPLRGQGAAPSLTCMPAAMTGSSTGDGSRARPVVSSNLRNFRVTASLRGAPGVRYESLFFKSGSVPPLPATLALDATEVGWFGRRTPVDTRLVQTLNGDEKTQIATCAHLDEMQRTGKTAPLTPQEFPARRGDMYGAIDAIFTQNRIGLFELTCSYTSRERGAWMRARRPA